MADWDVASDQPDQANAWNVVSHEAEPSFWQKAAGVAAQVPQGINEALAGVANMPGNATAWLLKQAGLRDPNAPPPSETTKGALASTFGITQPIDRVPETTAERIANATGNAIGNTAATVVPFSLAGRAASALQTVPSVASRVGQAMTANPIAQTALGAASNVVTDETKDKVPEWARPYYSMAVPFALGGMTHMGQRAVSAAPAATTQEIERRGLLDYGRSIGAPLTAGKIIDSKKLQTYESAVEKYPLPFMGGRVAATEAANRNAYQSTALKTAGIEGETAATPNVTQRATNRLGQRFNDLTRDNELTVDSQFGADIAKAKEGFSQQLEAQMPKDITKQLDELATAGTAHAVGDAPKIDGRTYQNIRSKLSAMLPDASGTDKRAIGGMIDALDGVAERSLPKDTMADFKDARRQWRNLMAIRNAVGSSHNTETAVGNIPTARFSKESAGNPDLERLAQYGDKYVGDKIPNSGTAQRHAAGGIFGALAGLHHFGALGTGQALAAAGAAAAPYGLDVTMNNPLARALLLQRYRNPSAAVTPFGALGVHAAMDQSR